MLQETIPALVEHFRENGFVVARGIVPPGVILPLADFITGKGEQYREEWRQATGTSFGDVAEVRAWLAPRTTDPGAFAALPDDIKHLARGELPLAVRLDERLRVIAHVEALTALLCALLDCEALRQHNPPSIRFSQPGMIQGNVPLHQDWAYNQHIEEFVTCWVPLCPIDEECGGVDVYAGSHRLGRLDHEAEAIWGNCIHDPPLALSECRKEHAPMMPGDVLLFRPELLHGSHPNSSSHTRFSIDYRFFDASRPSAKHAYDPALRRVVPPPDAADAVIELKQ